MEIVRRVNGDRWGFPMADGYAAVLERHSRSMPLLEHLEELRKRIILAVVGVLVGFLSCWSFADRIFGLMQQPIIHALRHHGVGGGLVYLNPTEPFNLYLEVGLVAGLFAASPFVFYQLWLFIAPGLGLIFEMPILIFFLALLRVVTVRWMWRNLRYSILAIFVIAAIVTPTTDILNMCLFAAPMVALYVVSIGVAWLLNRSQDSRAGVN